MTMNLVLAYKGKLLYLYILPWSIAFDTLSERGLNLFRLVVDTCSLWTGFVQNR